MNEEAPETTPTPEDDVVDIEPKSESEEPQKKKKKTQASLLEELIGATRESNQLFHDHQQMITSKFDLMNTHLSNTEQNTKTHAALGELVLLTDQLVSMKRKHHEIAKELRAKKKVEEVVEAVKSTEEPQAIQPRQEENRRVTISF